VNYEPGQVVRVPFPFTNREATKIARCWSCRQPLSTVQAAALYLR